ncbi:Sugar (and other) transporter [Ceratobasidium sp. AG-Ba]|nr:Sugar (and other) transporter [Ceratobasidium sp. AG-Ba]
MTSTLEVKRDRTPSTRTSPGFAVHELSRQFSHPEFLTYDERRRAALKKIDDAEFSWFHVRACLVSGIGFFTDAYDIFAINIAAVMIGMVYGEPGLCPNTVLDDNQDLGLKVATPIGTLVGQLLFGWLADLVGRKRMYGVELIIIIISTVAQAIAGYGETVSLVGALIVWRVFMGIGIGGDYPLSAVITSEFAATRIRGRMMTAVFSMQGFGNFAAVLISLIVTQAYKPQMTSSGDPNNPEIKKAIDHCWRLLIGLGAVPGVLALFFRLTIPETPRYTLDIERNVHQAVQDVNRYLQTGDYDVEPEVITERVQAPKASWQDFVRYFGQWKNGKILLGAAYSWFALDVAYYGLGLNASIVLRTIGYGEKNASGKQLSNFDLLRNLSVGNIIISLGGLIPGYWATFFFIDSWGRKPIQLMGFAVLTSIFVCMGFAYDSMIPEGTETKEAKGAFVFLYCLANFFQNFGPNTTTFIVPGEAFPTRYRSTAHGISAASGKLGAIISQVGFARLKDLGGRSCEGAFIKHILKIFAFFMLTGLLATFLIEETKGRTLEDLSNESQDGFISGGAGPLELELHDGVVIDTRTRMPLGTIQQHERQE